MSGTGDLEIQQRTKQTTNKTIQNKNTLFHEASIPVEYNIVLLYIIYYIRYIIIIIFESQSNSKRVIQNLQS